MWEHPEVETSGLAADGGGRRIALSVYAPAPSADGEPGSFLYMLEADGTIRQVHASKGFKSLVEPIFVRPVDPYGPAHLYWLERGSGLTRQGRFDSTVFINGEDGAEPVEVPLRQMEGVWGLHASAGNKLFSLSLFRRSNELTRFEVLVNRDAWLPPHSRDIGIWRNNTSRGNTESVFGAVWLTHEEYVIPVVKLGFESEFSLRGFLVGCETFGSRMVYQGAEFDTGLEASSPPWRMLPGGDDTLLMLAADDIRRSLEGVPDGGELPRDVAVPFTEVSVADGSFTSSQIMWRPGPWAYVYPDVPPPESVRPRRECLEHEWVWP